VIGHACSSSGPLAGVLLLTLARPAGSRIPSAHGRTTTYLAEHRVRTSGEREYVVRGPDRGRRRPRLPIEADPAAELIRQELAHRLEPLLGRHLVRAAGDLGPPAPGVEDLLQRGQRQGLTGLAK